jgi:arginine decarboxylase
MIDEETQSDQPSNKHLTRELKEQSSSVEKIQETPITHLSKEDADRIYGFTRWGEGYFDVNDQGHLAIRPEPHQGPQVDIVKVVEEMRREGVQLPAVIRFQDILRSRVKNINRAFRQVIEEADYEGRYIGVYPVKVNQMREVVEEIMDAGAPYDFGLEAGSKPELLSVLALNTNQDSLTVLNGYKDEEYLRLAILGTILDRKVVVVIEKYSELKTLIRLAKEAKICPIIGLRAKLAIKGMGKWENSSGDKAKFGLTTPEIINAVQLLKQEGLADKLKLFHFHIGSQIPNIRHIKDAIAEGARVYVELHRLGINIEYFDVGGGLGVDYDGTHSTNESSINYNTEDYAADVVYGLKQNCDIAGIPHPNIVSESGRAITAHHSCVITNVIDIIDGPNAVFVTRKTTGEHLMVGNMRELGDDLNDENYQQIWNDAGQLKDECINAFRLGVVGLEERAKLETIYWQIASKIKTFLNKEFLSQEESIPEQFQDLEDILAPQYLCNFSVFQSTADSWAIKQLLPIMPIDRLNEVPTRKCSIADITCDSDGKIDRFMEEGKCKKTVLMHNLDPNEPYYIGIFLTGAYQDVMGDMHNLFGRLNEVHVYCDTEDPDNFYIEEIIRGQSASTVLSTMQYNPEFMAVTVKKAIDRQVQRSKIPPREGVKLVDFYEECLRGYTYLKT